MLPYCMYFSVFLFLISFTTPHLASLQSISVQGQLTCGGHPAGRVKVKLYDENTLSLDNKLDEGRSDSNGVFLLQGAEKSAFTLNPKINVYHRCHYWNPICYQKFTIHIPSDYITSGLIPQQTFDAGRFNLEAKFPGQSTDCFN